VVREGDRLPRYQRLVDGLVLPAPIGGHPVLDFCNTLAGWDLPRPREYLTSYAHLVAWAHGAGLLDTPAAVRLGGRAELEPARAARAVAQARKLRTAIYAACTDQEAEDAWNEVARQARSAVAAARLDRKAPPGRRWRIRENAGLARPVLEIALAAGDLLAGADLGKVGRCPGRDCGWLFLDPRGRRRWCSMAVCGNRAKARRHADQVRRSAGREAARR
jgi:predicted RNA-binding Zn ribbon-like protein